MSYKIQYRDMKKKKTNSQMMNWDLFFFDDYKCLRLNKMPTQMFTGKNNTTWIFSYLYFNSSLYSHSPLTQTRGMTIKYMNCALKGNNSISILGPRRSSFVPPLHFPPTCPFQRQVVSIAWNLLIRVMVQHFWVLVTLQALKTLYKSYHYVS